MMLSSGNGTLSAVAAALIGVCAMAQDGPGHPELLEPTPSRLPRWRGFNLQEKFHLSRGRKPFNEEDFRIIADLGFNFARLPMDYRFWIVDGDWNRFDETCLAEIDQAVEWGRQYGIHVMINFHRAPGYTVARPKEPTSLWTDPETQNVCARHWAMFARRYRGIPNSRLSFNLVNEPNHVDAETYLKVVALLAEAIRAEDPDRLIVSDSFFGSSAELGDGLNRVRVAFSPHQYWPGQVTHYMASWVNGADAWPEPTWPMISADGVLYSPAKSEKEGLPGEPLRIRGPLPKPMRLRLRVNRVSSRADLAVTADGQPLWQHTFKPGPGEGDWKESTFMEKWNIHQAVYDRDYTIDIPAGTQQLDVALTGGDWMSLSEIGLAEATPDAGEHVLRLTASWGRPAADVHYRPDAPDGPYTGGTRTDIDALRAEKIRDWQKVEAFGVGVHIGEFGVFNRTPQDVALRWMSDTLTVLREAGWGWALWNLRGGFGILDSNRNDVEYEQWRGHKLDRKMLTLLQNN